MNAHIGYASVQSAWSFIFRGTVLFCVSCLIAEINGEKEDKKKKFINIS